MTSHVMPTADSEADAETLVLFHDIGALSTARHLGALAGSAMNGARETDDGYGNRYSVDRLAFYAARAAFRAVPGLRVPDFESEEDR